MSVTHDDVLRAAMQLPDRERMLLAEELIESVPEMDGVQDWSDPELLACLAGPGGLGSFWSPCLGDGPGIAADA